MRGSSPRRPRAPCSRTRGAGGGSSFESLRRANLLRRIFLLEVLTCACGAKRRVVSSVEEGRAAQKILRYLGLPHEPPKLEPARIDQADFWATGPPAEDTCEPPPADDWDQRSPHDDLA